MSTNDVDHREFLDKLYRGNSHSMYLAALRKLKNHYLAEVAVQGAMVIALEKKEQLVAATEPVRWLYGVLHMLIKNIERAQHNMGRRTVSLEECSPTNDLKVVDEVSIETLYKGTVTSSEFEILDRLYLRGETYKELADEKGVSPSAIGMKAKRAKENFRKKYEK